MQSGRWLIVDTGFGRYLGRGESKTEADDLLGRPALVLESAVRIETVNLPSRNGIVVQAVPSSPVPWVPLFLREARIVIPLDGIVWYAEVSEDAIVAMRQELFGAALCET